jgi:hypothetical protein
MTPATRLPKPNPLVSVLWNGIDIVSHWNAFMVCSPGAQSRIAGASQFRRLNDDVIKIWNL